MAVNGTTIAKTLLMGRKGRRMALFPRKIFAIIRPNQEPVRLNNASLIVMQKKMKRVSRKKVTSITVNLNERICMYLLWRMNLVEAVDFPGSLVCLTGNLILRSLLQERHLALTVSAAIRACCNGCLLQCLRCAESKGCRSWLIFFV